MAKDKEQSSYLSQLKFDPKLLTGLVAKYLFNLRLIILLILAIIGFGIFSYINLPRNISPDIKIAYIVVTTVLPGASPNDVESLVTVPLEDSIQSVQKIQLLQSTSQDSVSVIVVQFETGVDPEKARTDVQSAVDSTAGLPQDAQSPKVTKIDFENQPIWSFDLVGKGDSATLLRFANELKTSLDNVPSINKVVISGLEEQEIQILIKPEVISNYNLNPQQVTGIIKAALKSLPAGMVKTDTSTFALTIDPASTTVEELRQLKVNLLGQTVSLGDIAVISQRSKPDQPISYIIVPGQKPVKAVSFDIYRNTSYKIDQAISDAKSAVNKKVASNQDFTIYSVTDIGGMLDEQWRDLIRDFILTIILVGTILFIFLGVRQAAIASAAIPLTFLITFIAMNATGVALSFIATFSLLLSLGLLVDDTIVIVSAMTAYFRSGKFTPEETGLLVWRDFLTPVLTTTTTTVWAFLPLLISYGIIGEFIKPIPIVVSSTLVASIFVALLITLPVMIFLLKPKMPLRVAILLRILLVLLLLGGFWLLIPKSNILIAEVTAFLVFLFVTFQTRSALVSKSIKLLNNTKPGSWLINNSKTYLSSGVISFQKLSNIYKKVVQRILRSSSARRKTVIMVVIFSIFSYLLLPLGFVKSEFFPKTDSDYLSVNVEMPTGTNLTQSNAEAIRLAEELKDVKEVYFIIADVGKPSNAFISGAGGATNRITLSVELVDKKERQKSSSEIAQVIRQKFANYQKGQVSVTEQESGPPAGADVQIKFFGPDLTILDNYANKTIDYLNQQHGITNIDKSIKPGTGKLVFVPDQIKVAQTGLTQDQLGYWLRLYASGFTADTIKLPEDVNQKKDISIRLNPESQKVENITSLNIPTPTGLIPLGELGTFKLEPNPSLITREGGERTISVTASVTKGTSIPEANQKLGKFADSLNLQEGYKWSTGGANEENQNSTLSVLKAMVISIVLIIITMIIQFNSFRKALIVILVIPLSISGVFVLFALTQTYLSFPALIGVLALFGIVVKNSILLVDKIIANNEAGMEFVESISDAAASRLEAIALTSIATITGLIPITISDPLWRGLGGAIIAGLTFSGTIMLFFIPVVYYLIFKKSEGKPS